MNPFLEALARDEFFRKFLPEDVLAQLAMKQYQQHGLPRGTISDLGTYGRFTHQNPQQFNNMPEVSSSWWGKPNQPYMDQLQTQPNFRTRDNQLLDPTKRRSFNWM